MAAPERGKLKDRPGGVALRDRPGRGGAFEEPSHLAEGGQKDAVDLEEAADLRISRRDRIYMVGQLALMFETGLNLMTAFDCLAQEARNPAFALLVRNLRILVGQGKPLWMAMSMHPRVFPPLVVNMVRAGEVSGRMGQMLSRLEDYLERENNLRNNVRSALSYPVFMLVLSMGVLVFLITYVYPQFEVLFKGKEESLPFPTRFFLGLSRFISGEWFYLLPALAVLVGGVLWALRREEVRRHVDPLLVRTPLLGNVLARFSLCRSFHTLGLLLGAGIPMLEALRMARDVAGNLVFKEAWSKVSHEVENGREIVGPLRETPRIMPSEIQMIAMGDTSGRLSQVLAVLSRRGEREVELAVKGLVRFLEPALIIAMGFLVGMIVLSLILPIFAMSRAIG